jgi:hypothetical protein
MRRHLKAGFALKFNCTCQVWLLWDDRPNWVGKEPTAADVLKEGIDGVAQTQVGVSEQQKLIFLAADDKALVTQFAQPMPLRQVGKLFRSAQQDADFVGRGSFNGRRVADDFTEPPLQLLGDGINRSLASAGKRIGAGLPLRATVKGGVCAMLALIVPMTRKAQRQRISPHLPIAQFAHRS